MMRKGLTARIVPNRNPNQNKNPSAVDVASNGQMHAQSANGIL